MFETILRNAERGKGMRADEALWLLREVPLGSARCETLKQAADQLSRRQFGRVGEVHAQIGLNWGYCGRRCGFCPLCTDGIKKQDPVELDVADVVSLARDYQRQGVNSISLMSTAGYRFERFENVGRAVSKALPSGFPLVANYGDVDDSKARALVGAGFTGFYHAIRLREGVDTNISKECRVASIEAATRAGLFVGSCLEPIGPEHTCEEIIESMTLLRRLGVGAAAVMKRVVHPGTDLEKRGEIDISELARIAAVTRLFFGNSIVAFGAHEPNIPCLRAGANLVYAECGANPREQSFAPEAPRGRTVQQAIDMLKAADLPFRAGSTRRRYLRLTFKRRPADVVKYAWRYTRSVVSTKLSQASH